MFSPLAFFPPRHHTLTVNPGQTRPTTIICAAAATAIPKIVFAAGTGLERNGDYDDTLRNVAAGRAYYQQGLTVLGGAVKNRTT